jgi:hypothetical protein
MASSPFALVPMSAFGGGGPLFVFSQSNNNSSSSSSSTAAPAAVLQMKAEPEQTTTSSSSGSGSGKGTRRRRPPKIKSEPPTATATATATAKARKSRVKKEKDAEGKKPRIIWSDYDGAVMALVEARCSEQYMAKFASKERRNPLWNNIALIVNTAIAAKRAKSSSRCSVTVLVASSRGSLVIIVAHDCSVIQQLGAGTVVDGEQCAAKWKSLHAEYKVTVTEPLFIYLVVVPFSEWEGLAGGEHRQ